MPPLVATPSSSFSVLQGMSRPRSPRIFKGQSGQIADLAKIRTRVTWHTFLALDIYFLFLISLFHSPYTFPNSPLRHTPPWRLDT